MDADCETDNAIGQRVPRRNVLHRFSVVSVSLWCELTHSGAGARQADRELGELADPAVDRDCAAMPLSDDVVADREPKPGALASRLGGEERLEELVPDVGRDAD